MNEFLFYRVISMLAKLLSRRAAYAMARPAAGWAYAHNHAAREALTANLQVVLNARGRAGSESELEHVVRRAFQNFGKYMIDFFQMGRLSPEALNKVVSVEHVEHLQLCRGMKNGIIGVTAHVGNWELGPRVLELNGFQVSAVALQQPSARLNALFQSQRAKRGIRVLPMQGAASLVQACLKRNELVGLLADLDFSDQRRRVPFFGRPARLPRGSAVLAARSGATILPAFVLRQADDTFCFRPYPPIIPQECGTIDDIQKCICTVLEDVIGNHPDQWFAFEPVWSSP